MDGQGPVEMSVCSAAMWKYVENPNHTIVLHISREHDLQ